MAGEGAREITASTPEQIDVVLRFIKPFKAKTGSSSRSRPRDQVARLMRLAGIHGVVRGRAAGHVPRVVHADLHVELASGRENFAACERHAPCRSAVGSAAATKPSHRRTRGREITWFQHSGNEPAGHAPWSRQRRSTQAWDPRSVGLMTSPTAHQPWSSFQDGR
jgi:hypothetical protein